MADAPPHITGHLARNGWVLREPFHGPSTPWWFHANMPEHRTDGLTTGQALRMQGEWDYPATAAWAST